MLEVVVLSGKGGTGKTSITSSFAALSYNAVFADCDVDAADLHLILEPEVKEKHEFYSGYEAEIIEEKCISCGKCSEVCRFDAISIENNTFSVNSLCEGCGVCVNFCPSNAISFDKSLTGEWYLSDTRLGQLVHAKLRTAAENSGKLVTKVKNEARLYAEKESLSLIIVDGPPGTSCPVIASITGSDIVVLVTEPSLSGIHDMERVHKLATHFKIPTAICINKWDINPENSELIEKYAFDNNCIFLGKISYSPIFTKAQIESRSVVEIDDGKASIEIVRIWAALSKELKILKDKKLAKKQ
ncbi:MAG: ATP-binding protein [Candidatus Delongbacteria bacterium]|nr:ATP-binding protein [Candidatus Delongbacteria bacterium]MBN2835110.1 ATP-binding protein [Candidatus Delongbacteria bacterium]